MFPSARRPVYTGNLRLSTITIEEHSADYTESKSMHHAARLPIQHVNLRRGERSAAQYSSFEKY